MKMSPDTRAFILASAMLAFGLVAMVRKPIVEKFNQKFNDWFPPTRISVTIENNGWSCEYLVTQQGYTYWIATKADPTCGVPKPSRKK